MNNPEDRAEKPPEKTPPTFSFASAPSPNKARQIIGDCVRAARMAANMTQQELAGQDFSKSYISAVERGKMTPSLQALGILAERLGVTISYILGEEANKLYLEAPEVPAGIDEHSAMLSEAERLLREGRYEEAITLFAQTGQRERTNLAREHFAQFLASQGRYQEAYEQMAHTLHEEAQEQ